MRNVLRLIMNEDDKKQNASKNKKKILMYLILIYQTRFHIKKYSTEFENMLIKHIWNPLPFYQY